jgi:flagellar L-ring protein FlgH
MNKPFSFRSELQERVTHGADMVAVPAPGVSVRWHRPIGFAVPLTEGRATRRTASEWSGVQLHLLRTRPSTAAQKPPRVARFLRMMRAALFVLVALPCAASAQSLWKDDVAKPMFADKRATGIGDILTILVQESTSTSKDNKTATGKESGLDASLATFLYSPAASGLLTKGGQMPAMKFSSKSDFTGGGSINNSEKITARAAVQVKDVLPNHNLVIEGRRETTVAGEQQTMVLRGIVRPEDVTANNTVFSYNIADATVQIISKGTLTDSQRKGWFHKVWDKLSPF